MTQSPPELPCLICGEPGTIDGLVCSICKPELSRRAKADIAQRRLIKDGVHCPRCGNPKEPHSGEWCVACTTAYEPTLREYRERTKEIRRQLFFGLGRDAAARFVDAVGCAFSAELSTDDKLEALAAWSEGLSTGCGISEAEAKAEFARVAAARMDLFKPKEPISS